MARTHGREWPFLRHLRLDIVRFVLRFDLWAQERFEKCTDHAGPVVHYLISNKWADELTYYEVVSKAACKWNRHRLAQVHAMQNEGMVLPEYNTALLAFIEKEFADLGW